MQTKLIKNFFHDGFVVVRNLLDKKQIEEILTEAEIIKSNLEKKNVNRKSYTYKMYHKTGDNKFNTIHGIHKFHYRGAVKKTANNQKLKKIVKSLLNGNFYCRNIEFFFKPGKTGMPSPFHQDNFFWCLNAARGLNCWIALSNASKKNGGLCYLKSSHKVGLINHTYSTAKGTSQKIPDQLFNYLKFKKIFPKLKAGDCLLHHPEVIHGSYSNTSKNPRIGFVLGFVNNKETTNKFNLNRYKNNLTQSLKKVYPGHN